MPGREIHLEDILGRIVRTASGRPVGRIDDVRVEPEGDEYIVREILLGESGLRSRLFHLADQLPTFRALGLGGRYGVRRIPWDWLDFSDPRAPRFRASNMEGLHG